MILDKGIQYIVSDLESDINDFAETQEYERCALLRDAKQKLIGYLTNQTKLEDILQDLFSICFHRYHILRMHTHEGKRFVVFVLPNYETAYFYIDKKIENSESWKRLQLEYDKTTQQIDKVISSYYF